MVQSDDSNRDDAPPKVLELDQVFDAIDHPRRRYLLYTLEGNGTLPLWETAKRIAAWEDDVLSEDVPEEAIERVYVSLYHNHIPKLVSDSVIAFSETNETIEPASNTQEVLDVLDKIGGYEDSAQEEHAREEHGEGYTRGRTQQRLHR